MLPRSLPYWLVYITVVLALFMASYLIPSSTVVPIISPLTDTAKVSLDFLSEMTKLVTALNTAITGVAAAFTVKGKDWGARWTRIDGFLVLAVFILSAVSYYGVYLGYVAILGMVSRGTLWVLETRLQWAIGLQYYGTLGSVFILGILFARLLDTKAVSSNA